MAKTETKELTVWEKPQGFALSVAIEPELNPELAALMDESDKNGFEPPRGGVPIVSIRQKDLKDEKGKTIEHAGNFKMYDSVSKGGGVSIPDVDGQIGLVVTPIVDQTSRTYWANLSDPKPACKSLDGVTGVGNPGGRCATCKLSQWNGDERPKCNQEINVLVLNHSDGTAFVLRIGRSGLKPWGNFKALVDRIKVGGRSMPLHSFKVNVTALYQQDPQPHYVPAFLLGKQVDAAVFMQIKKMRETWHQAFASAIEVDDTPDHGEKINNELPDDVAAFNPDEPFM